jgi:lipopolysaccharide heptosyltransferase II
MVIDFQGLFKSALWVLLSRGKRRIGFGGGRELSSIVLNDKLPPYDPEKHAVERYLDLALHAGGKVEGGIVFPIYITETERKSAERLVAESIGGNTTGAESVNIRNSNDDIRRFFVVVPRARWSTKEWSDESFVELARDVSERHSLHVLIVGASEDRAALDHLALSIGNTATSLAGRTSLKELAAIFGMAEFAVTVDTGPMHLAAAMGTTTVALFGPTAPWRTGPYGKEHLVLRTGIECSPCFKRECPEPNTEGREDPKCMSDITPAAVAEAIEQLLKTKRGAFKE